MLNSFYGISRPHSPSIAFGSGRNSEELPAYRGRCQNSNDELLQAIERSRVQTGRPASIQSEPDDAFLQAIERSKVENTHPRQRMAEYQLRKETEQAIERSKNDTSHTFHYSDDPVAIERALAESTKTTQRRPASPFRLSSAEWQWASGSGSCPGQDPARGNSDELAHDFTPREQVNTASSKGLKGMVKNLFKKDQK